jgi:putative two-component system response regulator
MSEKKIIMLVDDNQTNLTAGRNMLKGIYTVYPIPSGEKLFEIMTKIRPDLILLDIEMPGMNGFEVLKKLKVDPDTSDIPVIFLTSYSDAGSELQGLDLGAIDYITKPFSPSLVIERIETHILMAEQKKSSGTTPNAKT